MTLLEAVKTEGRWTVEAESVLLLQIYHRSSSNEREMIVLIINHVFINLPRYI
jgi:hypothetical protein